jgi:hypothetical protein
VVTGKLEPGRPAPVIRIAPEDVTFIAAVVDDGSFSGSVPSGLGNGVHNLYLDGEPAGSFIVAQVTPTSPPGDTPTVEPTETPTVVETITPTVTSSTTPITPTPSSTVTPTVSNTGSPTAVTETPTGTATPTPTPTATDTPNLPNRAIVPGIARDGLVVGGMVTLGGLTSVFGALWRPRRRR